MGRQKTFKTLDEQIEILKNKGLIINYIENAKEILFRENYLYMVQDLKNYMPHLFLIAI